MSGYGTLVRYDRLWLLFTPDRILRQMMFEKGSSHPYLKTLFMQEALAKFFRKHTLNQVIYNILYTCRHKGQHIGVMK